MSEQAALLTAIAAHPEEDTPRLVYADWLDENADALPNPNAARICAEFIRVQCQIKRLEDPFVNETRKDELLHGQVDLWHRQEEILENHARELLGELAGDVTYFDAIFDRGFLTELEVEARVFLKHAEWIGQYRPPPRVKLNITENFDTFCGVESHWPHLHCVTACCVRVEWAWERSPPLTEFQVERFFKMCSHFARLEKLDLASCGIADRGFARLLAVAGQNMPALTDVELEGNDITDSGVGLLVVSPLWRRLKRLSFGYSRELTEESARLILAAASSTQLEDVDLRSPDIPYDVLQSLRERFGGPTFW